MRRRISIISTVICLFTVMAALASCSPVDAYVPAGMKNISSDVVEYKLYIPESWTADISTGVVSAYCSQSDKSNISMTAFELRDAESDLVSFWDSYKDTFEKTFSDMEYETEGEDMLVAGNVAKKYVYTATVSGDAYKFMQVTILKDARVYLFTYTATEANYDSHTEEIASILENISFN